MIATQEAGLEHKNHLSFISRHSIPGISQMEVEGTPRNLGIVKHFKNHPILNNLLPKNFSIAWVHLDPNEVLEIHSHNVTSMIIAVEGEATSQGDTEATFGAGDIVVIPAWNEHGFTGASSGFWGLSIQFNDIAIFEREANPLTTYAIDNIPTKEERQLIIFNRKNKSFKELLQTHIPNNLQFNWMEVGGNYTVGPVNSGISRLLLVCSVNKPIHINAEELYPGVVIVDQEGLNISGNAWLLSIEFNQGL